MTQDEPEESELLTAAEAAELIDVTPQRIYVLAREGRIGRKIDGYMVFTRAELLEYKAQAKRGRPNFHTRKKEVGSAAL